LDSLINTVILFSALAIPAALGWVIGFLIFKRTRLARGAIVLAVLVVLSSCFWPAAIFFVLPALPVFLITFLGFDWALAKDRK
jgi:hypothetical protein